MGVPAAGCPGGPGDDDEGTQAGHARRREIRWLSISTRSRATCSTSGLTVTAENEAEELVVVDDEENGIKKLFIDCEPPIVILEQLNRPRAAEPRGPLRAAAADEQHAGARRVSSSTRNAARIFYRDTLQLANLDANELEGSIDALSLAMAEYGAELLGYLKR